MKRPLAFALPLTLLPPLGPAFTTRGYYRFPAIHGDTVSVPPPPTYPNKAKP